MNKPLAILGLAILSLLMASLFVLADPAEDERKKLEEHRSGINKLDDETIQKMPPDKAKGYFMIYTSQKWAEAPISKKELDLYKQAFPNADIKSLSSASPQLSLGYARIKLSGNGQHAKARSISSAIIKQR